MRASKYGANGAKNTGSSSNTSTRANSAGNTNSSDGKIASHNVGWSLTVLNTMAPIPSIPRVRGRPPGSAPSDPGSTRRLFQVEVATDPGLGSRPRPEDGITSQGRHSPRPGR